MCCVHFPLTPCPCTVFFSFYELIAAWIIPKQIELWIIEDVRLKGLHSFSCDSLDVLVLG